MASILRPDFNTKELGGHRSNSLAFSKHDCHTCAELKKRCDRQRPRCGTCITGRRKCGGFTMDLVWKDLAVLGPVSPSPGPMVDGELDDMESESPPCGRKRASFKFIRGRPKRKRAPKRHGHCPAPNRDRRGMSTPYLSPMAPEPSATQTSLDTLADFALDIAYASAWQEEAPETAVAGTPDASYCATMDWPSPPISVVAAMESSPDTQMVVSYMADGGSVSDKLLPISASQDEMEYNYSLDEPALPLTFGVTYQSLSHKYSELLTLYDREFCVLPLTWDCQINPFRVRQGCTERSLFLLHAIMAVSMQHLAKKNESTELLGEMHNHWSSSIQLFSGALNQSKNIGDLLDTLLVLVSLETTQSASGPWGLHLKGALNLLEKYGSVEKCRESPRIRVQIAMLIWWDVTTSLVSRREPGFSLAYVEMLVACGENDGWTYFGLNGCPLELLFVMYRLARLLVIYEKTLQMEWTIFNPVAVDALVEEVKNLVNEAAMNPDDAENLEEDANARRNRYHCIEAWRHAILLYICRVFNRKQSTHQLRQIDHLTRVILDSVRCIPETEIIQKQLLLPIFLAASEVGDERNRLLIRQYLKHWSQASRFYHFESVTVILEEIWKDRSEDTRDVYWWGVNIPSGGWVSSGHPAIVSELMLG